MKSFLSSKVASKVVCSMATCLLASAAFAQGSSDDSSNPAASKAKSTKKSSTADLSGAAVQATSGESTASLATVKPKSLLGSFSLTVMNATGFAKSSITDGDVDMSGFNRLQVGYKLTDSKSVMMREDFGFSLSKKADPSRVSNDGHVVDPFIAYTDSKFATLPGNWVVTVQPRIYLPIGESSRFVTKAQGAGSLWLLADKSVGKFDFEFAMMGQVYNNTQDYSWAPNGSGGYKAVGNPDWTAYPAYFEVAYNFTDKLSLIHDSSLLTQAYRGGPNTDYRRKNTFTNETIVSYKAIKQVNLMASISDDAVLEPNNAVKMYQDNDVAYNVYLKLSL